MSRRHLLLALGIVTALLGAYLFYSVLRRYDFQEVAQSLRSVPLGHVALAVALMAGSFACIAAMEALAVRYAENGRRAVSASRILRTTVAALGIGHSIGLSALSSGAIRYRMYSRAGLGLASIGEIILFSGTSVGLGLGFVGGLALLWQGDALGQFLDLSARDIRLLGGAGTGLTALYLPLCALVRRPLRLGSYRLRLPSWPAAAAQLLFSSLNYVCVAGVLYAALRGFSDAPAAKVAALYVGSELSAIIAHVPGSWGVLEYIFTRALPGHGVVGALLVFRAVYYLLPLFVGLAVWLFDEIAGRRLARGERRDMKVLNA
ncbi:MAG TPA: YbhN family protein [Alphaproteobacteria bacterium]|jgi:hypothetical protein